MAKVLHFETSDGKLVELEVMEPGTDGRSPGGQVPVGRSGGVDKTSFDSVFENICTYADALAATVDKIKLKPSQVDVSFGMKIKGETGSIFAVFVKAGVDADLNIKLSWKTDPKVK